MNLALLLPLLCITVSAAPVKKEVLKWLDENPTVRDSLWTAHWCDTTGFNRAARTAYEAWQAEQADTEPPTQLAAGAADAAHVVDTAEDGQDAAQPTQTQILSSSETCDLQPTQIKIGDAFARSTQSQRVLDVPGNACSGGSSPQCPTEAHYEDAQPRDLWEDCGPFTGAAHTVDVHQAAPPAVPSLAQALGASPDIADELLSAGDTQDDDITTTQFAQSSAATCPVPP